MSAADSFLRFYTPPGLPGVDVVFGRKISNAFPRHVHGCYVLGLMESGKRSTSIGGVETEIPAGAVLLLNPGTPHACRVERHSYRMLCVQPWRIANLLRDVADEEVQLPRFSTSFALDERLAGLLDGFFSLMAKQWDLLEMEGELVRILSAAIGRLAVDAMSWPVSVRSHASVRRAMRFIREHMQSKLRLDDIAAAAALSPYHLQRIFKAEVGVSPHEFLMRLRVERARILLAQGDNPADVAVDLGFYDHSHLCRHFRRIIGVPPGGFHEESPVSG